MVSKKCNAKVITVIAIVVIVIVAGTLFILNSDFAADTGPDNIASEPVAEKVKDPHSSPESAITAYIDAYSRRDVNDLYEIHAEHIFQQKNGETPNTPDYYKPYMEEADRFYGNDSKLSVKINKVEYSAQGDDMFTEEYIEDVALIDCDIIATRGKDSDYTEQFIFSVKIDGKWYISN